MSNKVRLGIVGCGPRGIAIGRLFQQHPKCEITTLMDSCRAHAEGAATSLAVKGVRIDTDFDAMLRNAPVDALFFACDPMVQADLACQAMEAGRHVCTEVPAAFTMDECWKLVHTVEKTGCTYLLLEQMRYSGFVETWRGMHQRGEFGHICFAQGEYVHYKRGWNYWIDPETGENIRQPERPDDRPVEPSWRMLVLGDPIYYLPHTLSPLLSILDDRVDRVSCMGTRKVSYTYPKLKFPSREIEYALMHTRKDTVLAVGAGFSLPYYHRHATTGCHWYELRGTQASVESPRRKDDMYHVWHAGSEEYPDGEAVMLASSPLDATAAEAASGHGGRDFKPVDLFLSAIINDTEIEMDVYRAVETAAPAILAAESAKQNGVMLNVPDFRPEH